jgi:hypothetical protein
MKTTMKLSGLLYCLLLALPHFAEADQFCKLRNHAAGPGSGSCYPGLIRDQSCDNRCRPPGREGGAAVATQDRLRGYGTGMACFRTPNLRERAPRCEPPQQRTAAPTAPAASPQGREVMCRKCLTPEERQRVEGARSCQATPSQFSGPELAECHNNTNLHAVTCKFQVEDAVPNPANGCPAGWRFQSIVQRRGR